MSKIPLFHNGEENEQEIQLSQRDRATLGVIEYFACHWWIHINTLALQYPLTCVAKITLPIFLQKHQESLILLETLSMDALRRRKQLPTAP